MQIELLQKINSLIDLTSLNEDDSQSSIEKLCKKATNPLGKVASVCVYPRFIADVKALTPIKIATVVNFPSGGESLASVVSDIKKAIDLGALEIDMVLPYLSFLEGKNDAVRNFIEQCKIACGETILLKVILETGVLQDPSIIKAASEMAIMAGADFLKTSTGKVSIGATLPAARTMLMVIKKLTSQLGRRVGFKVSGGIRTIDAAIQYMELADQIMGCDWVNPKTFRIGASLLVDEIITNQQN